MQAPDKTVIDNRKVVIAIDHLFRQYMKRFEKQTLLPATKQLLKELSIEKQTFPIEGYYAESNELKEYFLNIRTLQQLPGDFKKQTQQFKEYKLLSNIFGSSIFGHQRDDYGFLPLRKDAVSLVLEDTPLDQWNIENITTKAGEYASANDDYSLVGCACWLKDSVLITCVKESMVLYSGLILSDPIFEWQVCAELEYRLNLFISEFNKLCNANIRTASPENARYFDKAAELNHITGRCIALGIPTVNQTQHYHWAIRKENNLDYITHDFWSEELWTTERYRLEKL